MKFAGIIVVTLSLLLSCTAAVRYSDHPGQQQQRAKEKSKNNPPPGRHPARDSDKSARKTADKSEAASTSQKNSEKNSATSHDYTGEIDRARMNRVIANFLGSPYSRGGTSRAGIDCSGLMYVIYRDYDGTRLPLSTEALYRLNDRVEFDDLSYGDLIFFRLSGRQVSHVGMYLENYKFVHASESRGVVVDDLTDEYYATSYAGARRVK